MNRFFSVVATVVMALLFTGTSYAEAPDVRMYRLDCGRMTMNDKSMMSDAGLYKGESLDIVMSCYLIKHGADWMLWDAGLPGKYLKGPLTEGTFVTKLDRTIVEQIGDLGLKPADIKYVAVSHAHFDHVGQLKDFPNATLIIQRAELKAIADSAEAAKHYIIAELLSTHIEGEKLNRVWAIDGDVDIFGDGTLKTIRTPGHTPGSMAVLLKLKNAGPYVLSGDQWHFTENHQRQQVPVWNYDHEDTITSGQKLDEFIANQHATLVIQHEPADNQKLPKFPSYLN